MHWAVIGYLIQPDVLLMYIFLNKHNIWKENRAMVC